VCCVLFKCGVLFCVMCVLRVLCPIVVPLPPGKNQFAVKINNNNNSIQYISVYNGTFIVTLPSHNMFRPYTAIIRYLYFAKFVASYGMSNFSYHV
jgi:hypothetical protein